MRLLLADRMHLSEFREIELVTFRRVEEVVGFADCSGELCVEQGFRQSGFAGTGSSANDGQMFHVFSVPRRTENAKPAEAGLIFIDVYKTAISQTSMLAEQIGQVVQIGFDCEVFDPNRLAPCLAQIDRMFGALGLAIPERDALIAFADDLSVPGTPRMISSFDILFLSRME